MNAIKNILFIISASLLLGVSAGCVREDIEPCPPVEVKLHIRHELPWTECWHTIPTGRASGDHRARYIIHAYEPGNTHAPAYRFSFMNDDLSLRDFETSVTLPAGNWELRAWQDFVPADGSPYYDADNFSQITHVMPYRADNDHRDAFEATMLINVPEANGIPLDVRDTLNMSRPLAKYVFIATDFDKFYSKMLLGESYAKPLCWSSLSADQKAEVTKGYNTVFVYPLFMPSVYSHFTQRVMDSWSGMNYFSQLVPISDTEARIGSDHVFINHKPSGVQVQLGLRNPQGDMMRLTDVITVPLRREQITYVRGNFLTAGIGSGLNIDFEFSGDINIPIQ